jgi:hypothetical protein
LLCRWAHTLSRFASRLLDRSFGGRCGATNAFLHAPLAERTTAFLVEHRRSKEEYAYARIVPDYDAVRTANHLYVEYETGEKELYNLSKDPYELTNRYASADAALRSELRARLNTLRDRTGPECRRAEDSRPWRTPLVIAPLRLASRPTIGELLVRG